MLDFRLDEEQTMLKDAISRYARERLRKVYRDAEEDNKAPLDIVQAGWDIGLLPTCIPEEQGGFGEYSAVTGAVAIEEFAWGDLAITLEVMVPNLVAIPLMLYGTQEQKEAFLPAFVEEKPPSFTAALTEPLVQFNPYHLKTVAVREEDWYLLNGSKVFVPLANEADFVLVYASEVGETQAFLVPTSADGLELQGRDKLMGIHALPTYQLTLSDVKVPASRKLGGEIGIDFDVLLAHSRVALGAAAVGVARAGYEYAREYAKQRVQFGEPIAHRQSIAFMLADMATDVEEARMMVWEVAWLLDQGMDAVREAAVMKQHVDRLVVNVADRAVQILGGYGYIREYPVELWLRNARGFVTFDGLAMV